METTLRKSLALLFFISTKKRWFNDIRNIIAIHMIISYEGLYMALCRSVSLNRISWTSYVMKYIDEQMIHDQYLLDESFKHSIRTGDLFSLKYLASLGANIHMNNDRAILLATQYGRWEIVKYLISMGCSIYPWIRESLGMACEKNHKEIAQLFLSMGTYSEAILTYALHKACIYGHIDIVRLLMDGTDLDMEYVCRWVGDEHIEILEFFVKEKEYDISQDYPILIESVKYSGVERLNFLIENGSPLRSISVDDIVTAREYQFYEEKMSLLIQRDEEYFAPLIASAEVLIKKKQALLLDEFPEG